MGTVNRKDWASKVRMWPMEVPSLWNQIDQCSNLASVPSICDTLDQSLNPSELQMKMRS